jgi:hypothetical protein
MEESTGDPFWSIRENRNTGLENQKAVRDWEGCMRLLIM